MLKHEDNERLVRVGADTPGGALFRRYWLPALLSSELPEKDGAPVRVRLLGEDLLAFRDSDGKVGLVDAFCPHRRAPLFFGRNEQCGIRCVYHGWKFDVDGKCVDMPSEPEGSPLAARVKLKAYPTVELGDIIWAYLGPAESRPPAPNYEWLRAPATHRHVSKTLEHCNYLQGLEGGLDTAHVSYLHNNNMSNRNWLGGLDGAPQIDVMPSDYGYFYVSIRKSGTDRDFVRVYQYIMPTQQIRSSVLGYSGTRPKVPKFDGHIWVPIDDENTYVYNFMYSYSPDIPITPEYAEEYESYAGRGKEHLIPGTFELKLNLANDFMINRKKQKYETFTGIEGVNTQDMALQEGMGPIVDRSLEFLGTSDKAIVAMRRMMLEATREVEEGRTPRGVDPDQHGGIRPFDDFVYAGEQWESKFAPELVAKF